MNKTGFLISTAVGLAFAVTGPTAMAVGKRQPNGAKSRLSVNFAKMPFKVHASEPKKAHALKLRQMVYTWATTTMQLLGGTALEDAAMNVNCKKPCTIMTNSTAEFLSYYSYNQTAICPVVDGYFTNGSCYFSGTVSPGDQYANRQNQTNLAVGSGVHTLETYVYTIAPAYLGHYQNDYAIFE